MFWSNELASSIAKNGPAKDQVELLARIHRTLTRGGAVDPWQAFGPADALLKRDPVEYVAAGLFALPSLNIVYGAPGSLKSFLMADLTVRAAAGNLWLPRADWVPENLARGIETRQVNTMWIDFDNGRRRTHDRIGALLRMEEHGATLPLTYYSMPNPWLNAGDDASIAELAMRIRARDAKLVVIDNLGVVAGDADEISAEMAPVMSQFRQVAEETGAAIVLIHHQRKSNGTVGRAGDTLRGHSSIEAALDLALLLEREEHSDAITIKATKVRGADVLPFSAVFTYTHDERGELDQAKFFGIATEDLRSNLAIEREIVKALAGGSMNKTELKDAVREALTDEKGRKPGIVRVSDIIDRLVALKRILEAPGDKTNEKVYRKLP